MGSEVNEIEVLCNEYMIGILAPIKRSRSVPTMVGHWTEQRYVAVYDEATLNAVPEDVFSADPAWWREVGGLNVEIMWLPEDIKIMGLWPFINSFGMSTEKNQACAIGDLAREAGKTPIELMNWCADNAAVEVDLGIPLSMIGDA